MVARSTVRMQSNGESPSVNSGRHNVRQRPAAGSLADVEAEWVTLDAVAPMFMFPLEFHAWSFFWIAAAFVPRLSFAALGKESLGPPSGQKN